MSFMGFKKFPAPVAKPMLPFYVAGVVVMYGVSSFASVLAHTDEFKDDPRNRFVEKKSITAEAH